MSPSQKAINEALAVQAEVYGQVARSDEDRCIQGVAFAAARLGKVSDGHRSVAAATLRGLEKAVDYADTLNPEQAASLACYLGRLMEKLDVRVRAK